MHSHSENSGYSSGKSISHGHHKLALSCPWSSFWLADFPPIYESRQTDLNMASPAKTLLKQLCRHTCLTRHTPIIPWGALRVLRWYVFGAAACKALGSPVGHHASWVRTGNASRSLTLLESLQPPVFAAMLASGDLLSLDDHLRCCSRRTYGHTPSIRLTGSVLNIRVRTEFPQCSI